MRKNDYSEPSQEGDEKNQAEMVARQIELNASDPDFSEVESKYSPQRPIEQNNPQGKSIGFQKLKTLKFTAAHKPDISEKLNIDEVLMNLCQSIATNDRNVFVTQLRKLMIIIDPKDKMSEKQDDPYIDHSTKSGQTALKTLKEHNFNILVTISPPDDLKQIFRQSFGYAIKTQQYSIVSDLVKYSKEKFFPLFVTSEIMDSLIIKRQFMLMQNLVRRAMIFKVLVQETPTKVYTEKYLKISDFIETFLKNKRSFLRKIDPSKMTLDEQDEALRVYFLKLLLSTQSQLDHENVVKLLIESNLHQFLIDNLVESAKMRQKSLAEGGDQQNNTTEGGMSTRSRNSSAGETDEDDIQQPQGKKFKNKISSFSSHSKEKIIISLLQYSIILHRYDISFEVAKVFLEDLLKMNYLPVFDVLFDQFKHDMSKYEVKIALVQKLKPFMKKYQAEAMMEIFDEVLRKPANESIFKQNINPLRVGLNLFKLIDDVMLEFNYSSFSSGAMKDMITVQIVKILEIYKEPEEMIPLMERLDIDGKDCFWYMEKYEMFKILDSKIMDKFINEKWRGRQDINCDIFYYSTSYNLLNDQHQIYLTENVFTLLSKHAFKYNKQQKTHRFKFHVWKTSMSLKYMIEFCFTLFLTIFFQWYIVKFNQFLHKATLDVAKLTEERHAGHAGTPEYHEELELLHEELQHAATELYDSMIISCVQLMMPINFITEMYFLNKTNRQNLGASIIFYVEFALFWTVLFWIRDWRRFQFHDYENDYLDHNADYQPKEYFMVNVMWYIHIDTYRFDFLLAIIAFLTWLKLFFYFRITQTFGPLFRILQQMILDLTKFLTIWIIVLIMFSCVGILAFGQLENFQSLEEVFIYFFQSSLGQWDMKVFENTNLVEGEDLSVIITIGIYYQILFLLVNLILMLNFVIAILSSTYQNFEHIQSGLYYNVLIQVFPAMGWDEDYGCLVCAQTPFNIMLAFLSPFLVMSQIHDKLFYYTNQTICVLLYLPFVTIIWTIFNALNLIFLPLSYIVFSLKLFFSILDQESFSGSLKRSSFLIFFVIFGPIFLTITFIADCFIFLGNLFTKAQVDEFNSSKYKKFRKESVDIFEETCNEMIAEQKTMKLKALREGQDISQYVNQYGNYQIDFPKFNILLQNKFKIMDEIHKIIYDNTSVDKFVFNNFTSKNQISPSWMSKINDFNTLKCLVGKTANGRTKVVDISLLKSFIEQVQLKVRILIIQKKYGQINLTRNEDQIFQDVLYEFLHCRPNDVEMQLVDDSQVLQSTDTQIDQITSQIIKLQQRLEEFEEVVREQKYDVQAKGGMIKENQEYEWKMEESIKGQ